MFPLGEFAVYCRFPDVVGVTQALYIGAGWKPPGSFGTLGPAGSRPAPFVTSWELLGSQL